MKTTAEIVKSLTERGIGGGWFEFEENWFDADGLGEFVSALSNGAALAGADAAYLVWGVDGKTHEIVGTDFDSGSDVDGEPLRHYLMRRLNPETDLSFDEAEISGKRVVLLTVPPASEAPVSYAGERYVKTGSGKENLKRCPYEEARLFSILRDGFPTIVNTPSEYQDLSFGMLLTYYAANGMCLDPDTFKKDLSLYTDDGRYNIMAQLLSDDSRVSVRVAIFFGKTKADRMYSVSEFGHRCLLYTLDDVLRFGDVLNIPQADEEGRVVERKEVSLFDGGAFREAVVNAFLHNRWTEMNEPAITVFSDRIEILSRGTLPPAQTTDGFFAGESIPVNEKLSEIFLQLHISEKTGRGVPRITQRYGRGAFEFRENSIVVAIPFDRLNPIADGTGGIADGGTGDAFLPLNRTQKSILEEIRANPWVTKSELSRILGLGKTTVDKGIAALRERGFIERVGANKGGYWKVTR